ncbi:DUF3108 domain-containing protein [Cupriavidus plantarum]|uniref:DUF3108 domain-containing protein n=1 Tax=Cupriavidus plantarum TaxID=942865 RepID=UPI000E39EAF5|nr:DUF3108 domain-containing protein [Cupriavidus plantarum]REE92541.1 hypothetical protein C7418_3808 [Cupriavidus plantarum]
MKGMGKWMASCALAAMLCACGGGGDDAGSSLNVSASGSAAQTASVGSGQATTLNVQSGDYISLKTSAPVKWQAVITSNLTTLTNQSQSDTAWSGNLVSPTGDTIQLTATLVSDASKVFKLNLTVAPQRYTVPAPKVGTVATLTETSLRLGGGSSTQQVAYTTAAIANDIVTVESADTATNTPDVRYTQNLDGNRLTRTFLNNGNLCTYAPKRTLYSFPMYVGKTWTDTWNYSCVAGYRETANVTATVVGYEPVTVAAGTYNALRVNMVITYTNSNDALLPNGNLGTATYSETITGWWSPDAGRTVKWVSNYGYAAGFSNASYTKTFTQELLSVK